MARRPLIFLIMLSFAFQIGFAQQRIEQISVPLSVANLGEIGKEKINLSYDESFKHPGDMGWFKFDVTEPQDLFLAVAENGISHGITLYDKKMQYINYGEYMLPLRLQPGTYYAHIEAYPGQTRDYLELNNTLNYTLLTGNTFEKESNDGLSEANNLGSLAKPVMIAGKIDPINDIDFFKFIVPEKHTARLNISAITTSLFLNAILYEYNESDSRYMPRSITVESSSDILNPGSYFVRLEEGSSGIYASDYLKDYVLCLDLSQKGIKSLGVLNKSFALNETGKILESDVDFYEFDVSEAMNVTIDTSGEDGDSEICLYDSNQDEIECNDDYNGYRSHIVCNLQIGKYYVKVKSQSLFEDLSYNISVSGR
jgi:hypothetical protein